MRLSHLIDSLLDIQDARGDDPEVRIATQPNWPLQARLSETIAHKDEDGEPIFLGEGGQASEPYAPSWATFQLGWSESNPDEDES